MYRFIWEMCLMTSRFPHIIMIPANIRTEYRNIPLFGMSGFDNRRTYRGPLKINVSVDNLAEGPAPQVKEMKNVLEAGSYLLL